MMLAKAALLPLIGLMKKKVSIDGQSERAV
jgi:hypothetical protein